MKKLLIIQISWLVLILTQNKVCAQAVNPIIHADVPDWSMIRVDDTYYMSSTTMHMSPGVPIMKSNDLVNWEIVNYAYDTLADIDATNLQNGQSMYGRGSWASSLRYHNGTYYVSTFSATVGRTFIFSTHDPESGKWERNSFEPSLHDNTLFFDNDGKIYMIWGGGQLNIVELEQDLSGMKEGTQRILIENAHAPIKDEIMLNAEGSQLFKVNGKYYLFNIAWPKGGMRTVIIHRADKINGPYVGRIAFQDKGIAQGGLIDTPEGDWYAFLFRDYGAVGRIPYLVPVSWEDEWPVLGEQGICPDQLNLPANNSLIPGIVASDEFKRKKGEPDLPLVWQWNHNPVNDLWSVLERKGYLRLTTGRIDTSFTSARNTLTQRTIGPQCTGTTLMEISAMENGDFAGLALIQLNYGLIGIKKTNNKIRLVRVDWQNGKAKELESLSLEIDKVYLKAACDFRELKDIARFYYSLDGKEWVPFGGELKMRYTLPHFMGYRFGLFNYSTETTGGYVDFDWFRISEEISE